MNNEEIQALMSKLQEAGLTPEDIADGILWPLFRDGKMSKEDLGTLCSAIGLELDPDFEKDPGPSDEPGDKSGDVAPGITKEEAEAAKEIQPGESKEEFEEKLEEAKEPNDESKEDESKKEEPSEEEEWEEAKKLFKL
jgi:hypothetical protein